MRGLGKLARSAHVGGMMKKLILALGVFATPALAQDVVAFNGYTVTIKSAYEADALGKPKPSDRAIQRANDICATVDKVAEYASGDRYDEFWTNYLFLCV